MRNRGDQSMMRVLLALAALLWAGVAAAQPVVVTRSTTPATSSILGGVKIGTGITVAADGTISTSASGSYLPINNPTYSGTLTGPNLTWTVGGPNWATGRQENLLTSSTPGGNTLSLRDTSNNGYSAVTLRDTFNDEVGSFWHPTAAEAAFTGSISGTTLTVTAMSNAYGRILVNSTLSGVGITSGTYISALGTGTGGVGTYTLNQSQTVGSETMSTYGAYGANFESSCLSGNGYAPCALPPLTDFRQTWQPGGSLTTRDFMQVDSTSRVSFVLQSTCNGLTSAYGMQITLSGQIGVCVPVTYSGIGLHVATGSIVGSRGAGACPGSNGSDCTGGDLVAMNTSAGLPTLRIVSRNTRKWDWVLEPSPNRQSAVDTDNGNTEFWSFDLDNYQGFSVGGPGSNGQRFGTFRQAPSKFSVNGDAQQVQTVLRASGTSGTLRLTVNGGLAGSRIADGGSAAVQANCVNISPNTSFGAVEIRFVARSVTNPGNSYSAIMPAGQLDRATTLASTTWSGAAFANTYQVGSNTYSLPTVAADTTNGCLNVSWAVPNSDTWHAVATVRTTEVQ